MSSQRPYEPQEYWTRLHREGSLRSVGQSGLPVELNVWLYRALERNLRTFLRRHGLDDPGPRRVLEIGAGTGYWTPLWLGLGAERVDGCDLAPEAVARLRERFPGDYYLGDIAEEGTIPEEASYDLVTVFNVLLHIIDEGRFAAAAQHAAAAVAPGGHVLLVEPALFLETSVRPIKPEASSMARPLDRYREVFENAGLEFVTSSASTAVANNPIEHGLPSIGRFIWLWRTTVRNAKRGPRRADLLGRLLWLADRPLMSSGVAPTGKFVLFRRVSRTTGGATSEAQA
jgi:SAM-dependent methyltransferase